MAIKDVKSEVEAIALKINPNGKFVRGLDRDGSFTYPEMSGRGEEAIPYIHLFPHTSRKEGNLYRSTLTILFLEQDKPNSTADDRTDIASRMEQLALKFLTRLELSRKVYPVEDTEVIEEETGIWQAHMSGVTLQIDVHHDIPCVDVADYDPNDYSEEDYQTQDQ